MAPVLDAAQLSARYYDSCPYGYSQNGCASNSAWYWWGRWVFAAICVVVVIAILFLLGCVNARRRRRRGMQPMYGTGWMGNNNKYGGAQQYPPQGYNHGQPPPPQYSTNAMPNQYTGNTFNANEGYYGQHNQGVELQQPANTYNRGGDHGYEPPPGPPPSKIA